MLTSQIDVFRSNRQDWEAARLIRSKIQKKNWTSINKTVVSLQIQKSVLFKRLCSCYYFIFTKCLITFFVMSSVLKSIKGFVGYCLFITTSETTGSTGLFSSNAILNGPSYPSLLSRSILRVNCVPFDI